ncbi:MAG: hypothetical protein IH823_05075 [Candidatus Dadabacteria bacterium]|nr:hypothetical protein [Candidatus Dadabacteria bacterium]
MSALTPRLVHPTAHSHFDGDLSLGLTQITVFPTASLDLGNVMIENGNVNFDPTSPDVTFLGDIIQNNCSGNTGTLIVEAKQGSDETDVLVQVTASTDVERTNGDEVLCENLLVGQTIETRGELLTGDTVDAIRVELQ